MNWEDILQRIANGENAETEFKRGFDPKVVGPALCALANTQGGVLVLGVNDEGVLVGVKEPEDKLRERMTGFLQSGLNAPVQARLGVHHAQQGTICWIEVPHQRGFEPLHYQGRVYVRRDRSSVTPSPSELQELYNAFGNVVTEEQLLLSTSEESISVRVFREFLKAQGLDVDETPQMSATDDLRNRQVIGMRDKRWHATLYGLMAFGREPQDTPQTRLFYIECVAYEGTSRAGDVVSVAEASGRLDEQVRRAEGWFKLLGRKERYQGLYREDMPLLPAKALREALVNAVVHRDYAILGGKVLLEVFDDRVVITSPGALPNHMQPENVKQGGNPRARNQLMTHFIRVQRLMEQRGRGWPLMRHLMKEHNSTEPDLEVSQEARFVRVTLWTAVHEDTPEES